MLQATDSRLPQTVAIDFAPVIRRAALRLARRLPSHVSVDDLVSAGYLGLVDAHRRYDAERCDRFEPYAELRIKGAMIDELRSSYDSLSRDLRSLATRAAAVARRLESRLGRRASEDEIASALEMTVEAYRAQLARIDAGKPVALDDDRRACPEVADAAHIADAALADAQRDRALRRAMAMLPERLRQVMEMYYEGDLTLRDIGQRLGVTESRVCQLHSDALRRLRAQFALSDPEARHLRPASRQASARRPATRVADAHAALPMAS